MLFIQSTMSSLDSFILLAGNVQVLFIRFQSSLEFIVGLLPSSSFLHLQPQSVVQPFYLCQILMLLFLKCFNLVGMLLQNIV